MVAASSNNPLARCISALYLRFMVVMHGLLILTRICPGYICREKERQPFGSTKGKGIGRGERTAAPVVRRRIGFGFETHVARHERPDDRQKLNLESTAVFFG